MKEFAKCTDDWVKFEDTKLFTKYSVCKLIIFSEIKKCLNVANNHRIEDRLFIESER